MKIKSVLLVALILTLISSFFIIRYMRAVNYPELPELTDVDGNVFDNSSLNGKVFIVSYFQTWCSDCVKEQPQLVELQNRFGKDNLEIILVTDESTEKIRHYMEKFSPTLAILHTDKGLKKELGVRAFPTTYLFGKQGELLRKTIEGIDWNNEEVVKLIEKQFN